MSLRNIIVTTACFIRKGNKYLLLHRDSKKRIMPNVWIAPGGKIELCEGLFAATRREVFEETGIFIKNLRIKSTGNGYLKDLDQEIFFHHILAEYASGSVKKNTDDGELRWLTKKEILKLDNLLTELRYTLPDLLKSSNKVLSYQVVYGKGNELLKLDIEEQ